MTSSVSNSSNYLIMDDPQNRHALSPTNIDDTPNISQPRVEKDESSDSESSREIAIMDNFDPRIKNNDRDDISDSESYEMAKMADLHQRIKKNDSETVVVNIPKNRRVKLKSCGCNVTVIIVTAAIAAVVLIGIVTVSVYALKDVKLTPLTKKQKMAVGCAFVVFFLRNLPGNRRRRGPFDIF